VFADRNKTNTKTTYLYKQDGLLNIWNQASNRNDLAIDETTGKTTLTATQVVQGTDGVTPKAGYLATSLDTTGNVVWTDPATISVKGDNLGNHIATQDLDMSAKDINNIKVANVKFAVNIKDRTATNTKAYSLYKIDGKFGLYNELKGVNDLTIDEATSKTTLTKVQIGTGAGNPLEVVGLTASTNKSDASLVVNGEGVVQKSMYSSVMYSKTTTAMIEPGASVTVPFISPAYAGGNFRITSNNECGYGGTSLFSSFSSNYNSVLTYVNGGNGAGLFDMTQISKDVIKLVGLYYSSTCAGGDYTEFNITVKRNLTSNNSITITNNGNRTKSYTVIEDIY
jgi:hypothetical protein